MAKKGEKKEKKQDEADIFGNISRREGKIVQSMDQVETLVEQLKAALEDEKQGISNKTEQLIRKLNSELYKERNRLSRYKASWRSSLDDTISDASEPFKDGWWLLNYNWLLVLFGVFAALITAAFTYIILILGNSPLFWIVMAIFFVVIFVVLISALSLYKANRIYHEDLSELSDNIESSRIKIGTLNEEELIPDFDVTSETVEKVRNDFGEIWTLMRDTIIQHAPYLKGQMDVWITWQEYKRVAANFAAAMGYYGIPLSGLKKDLINRKPSSDSQEIWEEKCIKYIVKRLKKKGYEYSPLTIELIYRAHIGPSDRARRIWREHGSEIIGEVARLLYYSERIPKESFKFTEDDLESLLENVDTFNLDEIRYLILEMAVLVRLAKSYHSFLRDNGLDTDEPLPAKRVFEIANDSEGEREQKTLNILHTIGLDVVSACEPEMSEGEVNAISLISLPLFFDKDIMYIDKACKMVWKLGGDCAIDAIYVYSIL